MTPRRVATRGLFRDSSSSARDDLRREAVVAIPEARPTGFDDVGRRAGWFPGFLSLFGWLSFFELLS